MKIIIENWSGDGLVPRGSIRKRCLQRDYEYVEVIPSALDSSLYLVQLIPEISSWRDPIYILKLFPSRPEVREDFITWVVQNGFDVDFGRKRKDQSVDERRLHADFYGDKLKKLLVGELSIPLYREQITALKTREQVREGIRERKERHQMERR